MDIFTTHKSLYLTDKETGCDHMTSNCHVSIDVGHLRCQNGVTTRLRTTDIMVQQTRDFLEFC